MKRMFRQPRPWQFDPNTQTTRMLFLVLETETWTKLTERFPTPVASDCWAKNFRKLVSNIDHSTLENLEENFRDFCEALVTLKIGKPPRPLWTREELDNFKTRYTLWDD